VRSRAARFGAVLVVAIALGSSAPARGDPGLAFATYLGGSGYDSISAIAVDGAGNTYVAGDTYSEDFPTTPGAFQPDLEEGLNGVGFLTKFDPAGNLVYSTYLALAYRTHISGVAVDSAGDAYVSGWGANPDYVSGLVVKVNPQGSALLYATGISGGEGYGAFPSAIAVDGQGSAYVTGYTGNPDFPTTPGAFDESFSGPYFDGFVVKLAPGGAFAYSTLLGGDGDDIPGAIAVDDAGAAYVTGTTEATDFPHTIGPAFGGNDTFLTRLDPSGSSLGYSTSLGALAVSDVAADDQGSAYLAGSAAGDAFVAKRTPDGAGYAYMTSLGGSGDDVARSIDLGPGDQPTISGGTASADFPTTPGAFDTTFNGATDAFATVLDATGSAFRYSTFLGGSGDESVFYEVPMLAVDGAGNPSLAGLTHSADFPITPGAFDTTDDGDGQFVARLILGESPGGLCSQPGAMRGAGQITGTPGDDVICGSPGSDDIDGRGGDDTILGNAGSDTIAGGAGADTVQGGRGADTVGGQAGNDDLDGGRGRDAVRGGDGDDVVRGSDGNDTLNGGAGADLLKGGAGFDVCDGGEDVDRGQDCERYVRVELFG
jgi:Ca2+-binding RTX toxin-like protein